MTIVSDVGYACGEWGRRTPMGRDTACICPCTAYSHLRTYHSGGDLLWRIGAAWSAGQPTATIIIPISITWREGSTRYTRADLMAGV